ncbi:MAG: tetratricopeptide repeat protein [Gammaproteobacteria bacterium]|nr:tetratricopeptide repeat protein [Gammaproteobacteria bacterium]MBT4491865.1 tetratricopeptide repeat protein [Gammaproteobacteria bacterium]MBT7369339.1 tetratricopeptide repeat protein [Gammaproteobacteria bacterium]
MNAESFMVDVTAENFQAEVAEKSKQMPVLMEFYAEGAEQCQPTSALLQKLAAEFHGKFTLARVEVQQNPELVQQLGIRALPTVKIVFQGQMAGDMEGPADEQKLREVLDQLTMSPMERVREQIDFLIAQGERGQAIQMLQQVIAEEPKNFGLHVELCDLLIMEGQIDDARQILDAIPEDTAGVEKPVSRLEFLDLAGDLAPLVELQASSEAEPDNLQAKYDLAIRLVVEDQVEAGLEALLSIMRIDKTWQEELARMTMIKVFNMLGKGDEVATGYRRKMFGLLH